jgi:hypothetical protein
MNGLMIGSPPKKKRKKKEIAITTREMPTKINQRNGHLHM